MATQVKTDFSISTTTLYAFSLLLICMYFFIAAAFHYFELPNFFYINDLGTMMYGIPGQWIKSQFWKIILLLPATVLLSIAISRAHDKQNLHRIIESQYSILIILLLALSLIIIFIGFIFCQTELIEDENVYNFEAKTLISGRITNPPPPTVSNFANQFIINDGRVWIGKYPLGHPLMMAIGMFLGSRYILTVVMSVLTLLLLYHITLELYNDKLVAFIALSCAALSPFFYFVSSSMLSHTTTAFFLALFIYLFLRVRRDEKINLQILFAIISGLAVGYAFNVRSLTALAFGLPFGFLVIYDFIQKRIKSFIPLFFFFLGFTIIFIATLAYNKFVTGKYLFFVHTYYSSLYDPELENLGFGTHGHTPIRGLINLAISIGRMNFALFGFPISLLFVFVAILIRKEIGDLLMLGIVGSVCFAYFFWYVPGDADIGPLYYYELIIPLCILTARGMLYLYRWMDMNISFGKAFIRNFVILSFMFAFVTYIPEKVYHVFNYTKQIREPYSIVQSAGIHHAIVMIKNLPLKGFFVGFRNPSPTFTDDVIYCRFADKTSNIKLADYFKDRALFSLDYNPQNDRYTLKSVSKEEL